jgi:hypothetical protein
LRTLVNAFRARYGKRALTLSSELMQKAQAWSDHLASVQSLSHSTLSDGVSAGWTALGENVGYASRGLAAVQTGLEHSPPHFKNLVGDYTEMGLGVSTDSRGWVFVTQVFARRSTPTRAYAGPSDPSVFVPISPRVVFASSAQVAGGAAVVIATGVPAGTTAVAVNLEVTRPVAAGTFQVLGPGDQFGVGSNVAVNSAGIAGQSSATTIVRVDSKGAVRVVGTATAQFRVTVLGYFRRAGAPVRAGRFVTTSSARLLDTRKSATGASLAPPAAGTTLNVQVVGRAPVPASGVAAAVVNVYSIGPTGPGSIQVGPAGTSASTWPSLVFGRAGRTTAGLMIVRLDAHGRLAVHTSVRTHVVVEVRGWFTGLYASSSGLGLFVPARPTRFFDTRTAGAATSGLRQVLLSRRSWMPACPSAVLGTATLLPVAGATAQIGPWSGSHWGTFSTAVADGGPAGAKNEFLVGTGPTRSLGVFANQPTHLVLDLSGWFT